MSEPTIVYVVSKGGYSDYRVLAVCSTMEKAEAFIEASVQRDFAPWKEQRPAGTEARLRAEYDIEPFPLDSDEWAWAREAEESYLRRYER